MTFPNPSTGLTNYRWAGLIIRSPVALPLVEAEESLAADVEVRVGPPPDPADDGERMVRLIEAGPSRIVLAYRGLGRFAAADGCAMTVPTGPAGETGRIGSLVVSALLPHLCHQRRQIPLHAATVLLGGAAIAIAGRSGAGKSTLAMRFTGRGHPLLSDDLCVLDIGAETPVVRSAAPWVKIAPTDPLATADAPLIWGKSWMRLGPRFHDISAPLRAILIIHDGLPDAAPFIERLTGAEALAAVPLAVSRWRQARSVVGMTSLFSRCTAMVGAVPLYRLVRPRNLGRLDELVELVERFGVEGP